MKEILIDRAEKTIYREGDTVVKLFSAEYKKSDILNEALNQARVEETGLNVPQVIEVLKIDGRWAIVSSFIEGETLENLILKNKDKEDEYLETFVDLQLEVLEKRCPQLNKLKDKMKFKIKGCGLDATTRYELETVIDGMKDHYKVCHGDFNPSNIIIGKDGKNYILDWSHATSGNASADAARSYLLFCLNKRVDLANKYLNLFSAKSDIPKQFIQKWLPVVAASQLSKGIEADYALLQKWVNIADYD